MTNATRILLVRARTPDEIQNKTLPAVLGVLRLTEDGWHFEPKVFGRKRSRVAKPTWEKAIPRWTGGLHRTESRAMQHGERISETLQRFTA